MIILRAALACILVLAGLTTVFAADATSPSTGGHGALRAACKADVETLCKGIQPGGGRIKDCLKANADKVSAGCKSAMAQAKAAKNSGAAPAQPSTPAPQ